MGNMNVVIDRSTPEKEAASKADRAYNDRMLRAYLKGKHVFTYGYQTDKYGGLQRLQHFVKTIN